MTRDELLNRWMHEAETLSSLDARVDPARLIRKLVAELESLFREEESESLTLAEAAECSGYSQDHIGRLIRQGSVQNVGRRHAPRVRRGDLPRKPHALRKDAPVAIVSDTSRRQIARSVVNSETRSHDGKHE